MAEIMVQISRSFKIDPSKCDIGSIPYPEQVIETLSVGDDLLEPRKVSFDNAFGIDDLTLVSESLGRLIAEAKRMAKPVENTKKEKAEVHADTTNVAAPFVEEGAESEPAKTDCGCSDDASDSSESDLF